MVWSLQLQWTFTRKILDLPDLQILCSETTFLNIFQRNDTYCEGSRIPNFPDFKSNKIILNILPVIPEIRRMLSNGNCEWFADNFSLIE